LRGADWLKGARTGIWAIVSLVIPAAAVFVWRESWWPPVVLVLWSAAAIALCAAALTRKFRLQRDRREEEARRAFLRTLSRLRHDWLNDLQIMYGYLQLNKPDKAAKIVDRIRERMETDSRISQLGHPELSLFLLSFPALCDHLRLEVKIAEGVTLEALRGGCGPFASGLIRLIQNVRLGAAPSGERENVLRIGISRRDGELLLECDFEGSWIAGESAAEAAARLFGGAGQLTETEGDDGAGGSWRIRMTFPLNA